MREGLRAKRSHEIRSMFGRIVGRYDLLNRLLSLGLDRGWRRALAARVQEAAPSLVLDVCCGTGDLALACAGHAPTLASDFSLPMVAAARSKAGGRLSLFVADALELPLAAKAVDGVSVAFGVRNFESLERGLAELARVLRPGGVLLVLEFSAPRGALAPVLGWWMHRVPPVIGRVVSGDPEAYHYLSASVQTFPAAERMCALLEEAGLERVTATPLTGGVVTLYQGSRPGQEEEKGESDGP